MKVTVSKLAACLVLLTSVTFASNASAHYLWIESSATGGRVYFGEPDALLREKSPGRLDTFSRIEVFGLAADGNRQGIDYVKGVDSFELRSTNGQSSTLVVADESQPVKDLTKYGLGHAKTNYYAKSAKRSDGLQRASIRLDLISLASGNGREFQLLYMNQPVPGAKLEVIAPNTWIQEHETGPEGKVRVNLPWGGRYVIHVLHVEKVGGEFSGARYESLRNHLSVSFDQSRGADPGPAVPPQKME